MRQSTVITAAVVVAVVVIGSVALRLHGRTPRPAVPNTIAATTSGVTPEPTNASTIVSGVAHGWPHSPVGAERAALAAVRLTGPIAKAGFISRADLIRSIASASFGPKLASASGSQLAEMTTELGAAKVAPADLVWSELPMTSRVTGATDAAVTVDVWSVLIVGVPGKGAPRQVWRTVTVTLVWERDDWRIDDWTTVPGPTPALAATAAISDVTAIANTIGWAPASVGGER
jgi:hypothetical protein